MALLPSWFRKLGIGSNSVDASSILDVNSTTLGSRPAPSMTETQRDAINSPANGLMVYNTDTNTLNQYNGSGWVEVGSGSGGGGSKNYISQENSDFETGIGDWAAYDDSTDYVDGTGSASGNLTLSVTTNSSEILAGDQSLEIAKAAADTQHEGVSVLSQTIDRADRGKVLFANISGDFSNVTSSGDWSVRAYDVTNSAILYTGPADAREIANVKGLISVPVYTESTTASIRLSLHCETTDATAYDIFIDEVKLGPSNVSLVNLDNEWENYTPALTNFTGSTANGRYLLNGDTLFCKVYVVLNAAVTGVMEVGLPSGFTIDYSKLPRTDFPLVGNANGLDNPSTDYHGSVIGGDGADVVRVTGHNSAAWNATVPFTWASGDTLMLEFQVPVNEVQQPLLLSENQLALQTIKVRAIETSTAAIPATGTTFVFGTVEKDNFNAYNNSTGVFTAPKTAEYLVSSIINFTSAASASRYDIEIDVGGTRESRTFVTPNTSSVDTSMISTVVSLAKGEELKIEHGETVNGGTYTGKQILIIEEKPDFTLYGAVRQPSKIQTKFLSADVTTDTTVSDLQFSNLTIGQWYTLRCSMLAQNDTSNDPAFGLNFSHNSNVLFLVTAVGDGSYSSFQTKYGEITFKAEATTISVTSASMGANSVIRGNGDHDETWAQLEEVSPKEEYTGW